jgi:hypothetical protein
MCGGFSTLDCGCDGRCYVAKTSAEAVACMEEEVAIKRLQLPAYYDPMQLPTAKQMVFMNWRCCTGCMSQTSIRSSNISLTPRFDGNLSVALGGFSIDCSLGKGQYRMAKMETCEPFANDPPMIMGCGQDGRKREKIVLAVGYSVVGLFLVCILIAVLICWLRTRDGSRLRDQMHERTKLVNSRSARDFDTSDFSPAYGMGRGGVLPYDDMATF